MPVTSGNIIGSDHSPKGSCVFTKKFPTPTLVVTLSLIHICYRVIDIGRRLETDAQLAGIFGKMTFFTGFTP